MTKYIKKEWPEYQNFMLHPDFHEKCFFCAETNSYFIPEDLYDEVTYKSQFPKKFENTNLGTIVCYETRAIVNGEETFYYYLSNLKRDDILLVYNHDTEEWVITKCKACSLGLPIMLEDSNLLVGINCEIIGIKEESIQDTN